MSTSANRILRIRVALNGRPLKSYKFNQPTVIVGRDPSCDVVLENTGVSRQHLKFELGPTGYYSVIDLESANGSLFHGDPLKKDYLANNDVIQIAKFTLLVNLESDQRNGLNDLKPSPEAFSSTTVLSTDELLNMEIRARQKTVVKSLDTLPPVLEAPNAAMQKGRSPAFAFRVAVVIAFLAGSAVGSWANFLLSH